MQLRRLGRIESELRLGSLITVWTALATRRACWERSSARLCCPPEAVTVRLTLPERCKLCGAIGSVVPETTITGRSSAAQMVLPNVRGRMADDQSGATNGRRARGAA